MVSDDDATVRSERLFKLLFPSIVFHDKNPCYIIVYNNEYKRIQILYLENKYKLKKYLILFYTDIDVYKNFSTLYLSFITIEIIYIKIREISIYYIL